MDESIVLNYGDQVACSNEEDFSEFWLGIYIAKHPSKDTHIVLLRERPWLDIPEHPEIYTYCKHQSF